MPQTLRLPRPRCGLAMTRKSGRFCLKTDVFTLCALFARYRSASFFKRFVPEIVPFSNVSFRKLFRFPAKPTRFVIARRARAPDAAIFDETICHPGTNYGCTERNRTINKERGSKMKLGNPCFCDRNFFLLCASVLRHGMPYLRLKDCHGRAAASQ